MKKVFWIIAVALLAIVIFLGIRMKNSKQGTAEAENPIAAATWFSDVSFWNPPPWSNEEGTITGDITKKTGLSLDLSIPSDDGDSRLCLMLINGNLPDIISIMDKKTISHLVKSGKVWRMEEFLKKYAPDSHLLSDFPEDIKSALINRDGDWFALPSHMESKDNRQVYVPSDTYWLDNSRSADGMTIIWNKSLLKRIGLSVNSLKTEEQVLAAFEKALDRGLQIDGNEVIPLLIDGVNYQDSTIVALQNFFGAEVIDGDGHYQDRILAPESKDVLEFLNIAYRKAYLNSANFMLDNNQIREYMASGRVLCFIGNVENTGIDEKEWYSSAPILSGKGTRPVLGIKEQVTCGWISTFVSKECKNPEAVARWLDYMTGSEGMMLSYYGYENTDYILNSDGLAEETRQGMEDRKHYSRTGLSAWWPFFNKDWYYSVTPKPSGEDSITAESQILNSLGKYKDTAVYDESLVNFPVDYVDSDSLFREIETRLNQYKKSQITTVIMSSRKEEFEKQYNIMTDKMFSIGIKELDNRKNVIYEDNCSTYGKTIEKVN